MFLKRLPHGLVSFKAYSKVKNPKIGSFESLRRFRGPQKSEKFNFSKQTIKSVDH